MINRVVLVGRLTKDIEVKKTQTGLSVASFTIAVNRRFSKDNQQKTDFINCVVWQQGADYLGNYAKKGNLVGVEGRIQTRNYDGADGKKVYVTEVLCESVSILESRNQSQSSYNQNNDEPSYNQSNSFDEYNIEPSLDLSSDDLPF